MPQFEDDIALYRELIEIFTSVRDFHTRFELPSPFDSAVAYLPFLIEECYSRPGGVRQYIVSSTVPGFKHPTLRVGAEVTRWNGIPIDRAVDLLAADSPGGNPAARHARALNRLTVGPMLRSLPPDGDWVVIGYRTTRGAEREYRAEWLVLTLQGPVCSPRSLLASDRVGPELRDRCDQNFAKKILFAPHVIAAEAKAARVEEKADALEEYLESVMPDVFEASQESPNK